MENSKNFETRNIKDKNLAHCEIFSVGIRLYYALPLSERHSAKDTVGSSTKASRAQMKYALKL